MREIKFRGKSVKNCEWLYGYLFPRSLLEDADYLEPLWIASGFENECMAVDTESIGQYTGLHDKKNREIYHGDICKIKFDVEKVEDYVFATLSKKEIESGEKIFLVESPLFNNQPELNCDDIEVIGNIHENPELLEGRE